MASKVKIYTKNGDKGLTSLYGGKRVSKSSPQVDAYGTIDELNSVLGLLLSVLTKKAEISSFLKVVQADLFSIGAHLAGDKIDLSFIAGSVTQMENLIDKLDSSLSELRNFILPGGSIEASYAHFVRTVCRRAERKVVGFADFKSYPDPQIIIYLNRLSDLMFVAARFLNLKSGNKDSIWHK